MRWITKRSGGGVFLPTDEIELKNSNRCQTVIDILKSKHPKPQLPFSSALLKVNSLPYIEDVEVTGRHIDHVTHTIQGGPEPGSYDSTHWQDILVRFCGHSDRLGMCGQTLL